MYGIADLKDAIRVTQTTVECPVKGCTRLVPRQRKVFKRWDEFRCPQHNIFISPSTFEYKDRRDNVLWRNQLDQSLLLNSIFSVKRETKRFARDNSEDAVTWNVFRYLEKQNLLKGFLSNLTGALVGDCEVIYWSYCQSEGRCWSHLQQVRQEFEINPDKGSEPDLIVKTDNALFVLEAKLNASNNTVPSSTNPAVRQKYENGCQRWYNQVFQSDFNNLAVINRKYELLRLWLLGSKIADRLHASFFLINLVPEEKEKDIVSVFKRHIRENPNRTFLRATWEDIYRYILNAGIASKEKEAIIRYFKEKTVGYDRQGRLQKAFTFQ